MKLLRWLKSANALDKKHLYKKWQFWLVAFVGLIVIAGFLPSDSSKSNNSLTPEEPDYPKVEVAGLTVKEACIAIKDKGWPTINVKGSYGNWLVRDSNCNDEHIAKHANYYNKNSDWGTDSSVELVFEIESYDELTDSEKAKYESLANDSSNNNSVNTNASAEPAENKKSESQKPEQKTDSQENYKMPEDISIYDTKELCERHAESKGYPNAEIKTSTLQGTDMENGKYYKVSGTLYIDEGFTSAERSVGEYACTADYNKWQVTTAYLNRQSL